MGLAVDLRKSLEAERHKPQEERQRIRQELRDLSCQEEDHITQHEAARLVE